MSEKILFFDMFPDYEPPQEHFQALSQAIILAADIDPATRRVEVAVFVPCYIPQKILDQVQKEIEELYGISLLKVNATYPEEELQNMEIQ